MSAPKQEAPRSAGSSVRRWAWIVWLAGAGSGSPAFAQFLESRCADCHFSRPDAPGARHLSSWDQSAHGRHSIGCESCHGGKPHTFELLEAHQGILRSTNPASPVARVNLPATCGRCHTGPFAAFQKSRHYELLRSGDRDTPTCVTCHDEVAATLLSPRQLEGQCASCHGAGRRAPNSDFPPEGRLMLEGVRDARARLKDASSLIRTIVDKERRARLEALAAHAAVPLREATDAGHAFVFDGLKERLAEAERRLARLYEELTNPTPR